MRIKLPLSIAAAIIAATACGAAGRQASESQHVNVGASVAAPATGVSQPTCISKVTAQTGVPFCAGIISQPAPTSHDVHSSAIVSTLNSGHHTASLEEFATTVFDASKGTLRRVACTQPWGTCPLTRVPVNAAWKPSKGSDGAMVVVDYKSRTVFDFWQVARNADGTVKVGRDGVVRTGWGGVSSLDGTGASPGATGSNLSHIFGMIRVHEVRAAVSAGGCRTEKGCDLASAIPHKLHFASSQTCSSYRSPATKSDGRSSGATCVPMGSVVYLRSDANCAFAPARPIEEAVCFALKKYGAVTTDSSGSQMSIGFEGQSAGQPGGSGIAPYRAGGLRWDYYDMKHLPWQKLVVAAP